MTKKIAHQSPATATPDGPTKYRVQVSLPIETAILLKETAKQMGISQSALAASLLTPTLPRLHKLTKTKPTPKTARRFRGESIDAIFDSLRIILKEI